MHVKVKDDDVPFFLFLCFSCHFDVGVPTYKNSGHYKAHIAYMLLSKLLEAYSRTHRGKHLAAAISILGHIKKN